MSDWRDRCEHGRWESHWVGEDGGMTCTGGRSVTDADVLREAAKLANYGAAGRRLEPIIDWPNEDVDEFVKFAAKEAYGIVAAALRVEVA